MERYSKFFGAFEIGNDFLEGGAVRGRRSMSKAGDIANGKCNIRTHARSSKSSTPEKVLVRENLLRSR